MSCHVMSIWDLRSPHGSVRNSCSVSSSTFQFLIVCPLAVACRSRSLSTFNASLSASSFRIYSMALASTIALLGFGCPMAPASSLCGSVGTARLSRSSSALRPSRYLRSTWLWGNRPVFRLLDDGDDVLEIVSLRSSRGRPRFR